MKAAIALAVLAEMFCSIRLGAQTLPDGNQQDIENAAVKYLRADASLRQSYALPSDAAAKLQKALDSPLNEEDERLVAAADEALTEFGHGAASRRCNWEMSTEDGPLASTAHRGAIMELVSVSGLRARLRFRDGDTPGAMDDLLAAMAAARHLSVDGSLASVLFAYKLENALTRVLALNLYHFSSGQLKELKSRLDDLPTGSSLGAAFAAEKVGRNNVLDIAQRAKSRDELIEMLLKNVPILESNRGLAIEVVDGCGGTVKDFLNCVDQQQSLYNAWASRFNLAPEQFEREYKAEIEKVSKENPVIRQFTPALPRFRWTEAYCQTRRALLQAAIAVELDGASTLSRHLDPYDRNRFSYGPVDRGFRLQSQLSDNGIPISLLVVTKPTNDALSPD